VYGFQSSGGLLIPSAYKYDGRKAFTDFIPACSGVLEPFLLLQFQQAATTLLQVSVPPFDLGTTWSTVRLPLSLDPNTDK